LAMTRPGKTLVGFLVVVFVAVGGVFLYTTITGDKLGPFGREGPSLPRECPLTGLSSDSVPDRPALAVKIENLAVARPQAGLDSADIVYEQPVEANITRFAAIFQCQAADRLIPIRSVRLVDANLVNQFGPDTLLSSSGGAQPVIELLERSGIRDIRFDLFPSAYQRDINRERPHDVYSSTDELYEAGGNPTGPPPAIFEYDSRISAGAKPAANLHIPFSQYADVFWRWNDSKNAFVRRHGDAPHVTESGDQIQAKNIIVQVVHLNMNTGIFDQSGAPSPEVVVVGRGQAIVFRNGQAIVGEWIREFPEDVTKFVDSRGQTIPLQAGNTWVELVPDDIAFTYE
jgi:hypothetical protein